MASILKTQTGTWRAFVHYKGIKKSQTFKTKAAATAQDDLLRQGADGHGHVKPPART